MSSNKLTEVIRAEDFLEYFLFPDLDSVNGRDVDEKLDRILCEVNENVKNLVGIYIWHKEPFHLIARTNERTKLFDENDQEDELPPHLYGLTFYGENVQDEWFIVELLFNLTKIVPGLIARVIDADGEFMLIEAAEFLPKWANPDTCTQRVYIYDNDVLLVQNSPSNTNSVLPVSAALRKIRQNPKLYKGSNEISKCIKNRFVGSKVESELHRATVYIPAAASLLLKQNPSLIAAAVRSFYNRDLIDTNSCRAMKHFPPEMRIYSDVTFTRFLYAMLTHSRFTPDKRTGWNLPPANDPTYKAHSLGVKIACGLEILASKATQAGDDIEKSKDWLTFVSRLQENGYFDGNLENSKEYCKRLEKAKEYFKMFADSHVTHIESVAHEALKQLRDLDLIHDHFKNENMKTYQPNDDNEDWLNISAEDLDKMLTERYGIKKTFHSEVESNELQVATDLTENLQTFLNTKSEYDGVELRPIAPDLGISEQGCSNQNTHRVENRKNGDDCTEGAFKSIPPHGGSNVDFNPDSFQQHLTEMLDFIIPEDNWDSHSDMSDFDEEFKSRKYESMADGHEIGAGKHPNKTDLCAYMEQMDRELAGTTIGKSFRTDSPSKENDDDEDFDDVESFKPVNIDLNALQNLAESYQAQLGGHGPAASLLGPLGIRLDPSKVKNTKKEVP